MSALFRWSVVPVLALCSAGSNGSGCELPPEFVEGEIRLAQGQDPYAFTHLEVRAFPDHEDGFDVRRIYTGDDDMQTTIPVGEVDFPVEFRLEGRPDEVDRRWRLLVWLTDGEGSTWLQPGEPFGHASFRFDCDDDEDDCRAEHVDVSIDAVGPPE